MTKVTYLETKITDQEKTYYNIPTVEEIENSNYKLTFGPGSTSA